MSNVLKHIKMDTNVLKSKFRGSLLGSLLGDCLGSPFEGEPITAGEKIVIQRYFDKLESPDLKGRRLAKSTRTDQTFRARKELHR